MPPKKRVSRNPPGVLCFSLDGSGPISKRARYDAQRRREVEEVRATGACLRCQPMKMPVCIWFLYLHGLLLTACSVLAGDPASNVPRRLSLLMRRRTCGC
jgi:hypothetical protein